ncbi:MAG: glucokinase [Burkholderiales bacterium]|nr:glucokinase [Burkholderiales bacterium]
MILAGDIGGTKALLQLATVRAGRPTPLLERRYAVASFADFSAMLARFLDECRQHRGRELRLASACFGAAGPASDNRINMTNLPWHLDSGTIATQFGIDRVRLVNDFEAAAAGVEALGEDEIASLQRGEPLPQAPRVVIGAGTGLGVAYALPQGKGYRIVPGEGGHVGFAPADDEQMRLWRVLHAQLGRVSVEHVVCGAGLLRIYEFLRAELPEAPSLRESVRREGAAAISRHALEQNDPLAIRALDLFITCYGAAAGDHALAVSARGGVYIAGGIARKILSRLAAGGFMAAFNAKGAHAQLNLRVPVHVVTTERLGLLGAALIAARR